MRSLMALLIGVIFLAGCSWAVKIEEKVEPTSGVLELTRITNEKVPEFFPTPSPDGKTILVTLRNPEKKTNEQWSIVSISIGQTGRQHLSSSCSMDPAWMPDGGSFIYTYTKQDRSRLVKSGKSSAITYVSASPFGDADGAADVSPDGGKIVFHTLISNEWMIATAGIDGSLFTLLCAGESPRWDSDGSRILFCRKVDNYYQVFSMHVSSGQVTQLTEGEHDNFSPCWDPDGKWIAFISNREAGRNHIFVMSISGDAVTRYTTGYTDEIMPAWSSDGYIYFCSNAGGKGNSYEVPGQLPTTWDYSDIWRIKPILPE